MDDVPHIALPIRFAAGAVVTVQQDTTAEIANCVAAIVSFPIGYREDQPEFGIPDPEFELRPLNTAEIEEIIETYEPRAALTITEAPYNATDPLAAEVQIAVDVLASEDT